MVEMFCARAQNGRSGLALVGPEGCALPVEAALAHIGRAAGVDTYAVVPGVGTWVLAAADVTVHGGATLVALADLQGGAYKSLLLLGELAVVEHHGYKRRGSCLRAYRRGVEVEMPASVMLALGLVPSGGELLPVAPPPALTGALAAAFGRAS